MRTLLFLVVAFAWKGCKIEKEGCEKRRFFLGGLFFLRSGEYKQVKCQQKGFSLSCSVLLAKDESRVAAIK